MIVSLVRCIISVLKIKKYFYQASLMSASTHSLAISHIRVLLFKETKKWDDGILSFSQKKSENWFLMK